MSRLSLKNWAQFSEIIAAVAVVVSLVFVVLSINRNTLELQAQNTNDLYDALREIEMTVLADAELADIVRQVETGAFERLDEQEAYRYTMFITQHMSIWEQMHARVVDGTVSQEVYADWEEYFIVFSGQMLPPSVWERRRAWFTDPAFQQKVDAAIREP
ncbi:MAG: hypothetical protein R3212_00265 [Xanthomonadales bacterium]|nr:hypothetical protein [Xanthomonadales bacterium]